MSSQPSSSLRAKFNSTDIATDIAPSSTTATPETAKTSVVDADYIDIFPTPSTRLAANYLAILCAILGCTMCMSNICAVTIWQIGPLVLDGGFLLFPLTYVITDVLVEQFYRRYANRVILWCCVISLACFCMLQFTAHLSPAASSDQINAVATLGLSSRIFIASIVAMLVSSRVNNRVYDWLRPYTTGRYGLIIRAWVSSFVAHLPDSGLFIILAFAGRQSSPSALAYQAVTSCLSALIVETLLIPVTFCLNRYLHRRLKAARAAEIALSDRPQ